MIEQKSKEIDEDGPEFIKTGNSEEHPFIDPEIAHKFHEEL